MPGSFHVCCFIPGLGLCWVNPSAIPSSFTIKAHHSFLQESFPECPPSLFLCILGCPSLYSGVCVHVHGCVCMHMGVHILSLLLGYKLFEAKARVFAHNHSTNIYALK